MGMEKPMTQLTFSWMYTCTPTTTTHTQARDAASTPTSSPGVGVRCVVVAAVLAS